MNTMNRSWLFGSLPLLLAACSGEAELYGGAQASTLEVVGTSCEIASQRQPGEVVIEHPEECGDADAVCLGQGLSPAVCSCRCSGPEDGLPLCDCPSAFHCEDELILELEVGGAYAGGYCVAN